MLTQSRVHCSCFGQDEQARPSRNSEEDSATPPFEEEDEEDMEENGQANSVGDISMRLDKSFNQPMSSQIVRVSGAARTCAGSGQFETCITCRAACYQGTVPHLQKHRSMSPANIGAEHSHPDVFAAPLQSRICSASIRVPGHQAVVILEGCLCYRRHRIRPRSSWKRNAWCWRRLVTEHGR